MDSILANPRFAAAFQRLAGVSLNPRRHTAANALAHCHAVAAHAAALARANGCSEEELRTLENLGYAHDLGKINGTAKPEQSLEVLRDCGVDDARLLTLVKWHDTNLPWYLASTKGQPPSAKAWRRLAAELDVRMLAMFMVADRVDAPPGWRRNAPTAWFLREARERGLLGELQLDLPEHPSEVSAGGVLVREQDGKRAALVIRVRAEGYELPKGGIEWDELPSDAAARETREEAGVESELLAGDELGHLEYMVGEGAERRCKLVRYFSLGTSTGVTNDVQLGALPERTRERRWLSRGELGSIPLVNEGLRAVLEAAL